MKYDLRAEIKSVLDSTSLADPGAIADKVAESIPSHALRAALRVTLRSHVRQVIRESRPRSAPDFQPSGSGHRRPDTQTAPAAAGRSSKVRAIREGWQRQLDAPVHVGESHWKYFGDCTYTDLYAMADERQKNAAENQAWAHHYHRVAALLTEYAVDTVRDLPAEVLMPTLGGVA